MGVNDTLSYTIEMIIESHSNGLLLCNTGRNERNNKAFLFFGFLCAIYASDAVQEDRGGLEWKCCFVLVALTRIYVLRVLMFANTLSG